MNRLNYIVEQSFILTKNGYFYIEDLVGNCIIWDGYKWTEVIISKNDNNFHNDIYYKVLLSNETEFICFNNQHLQILEDKKSKLYYSKPIYEIKENTTLYNFTFPFIEGSIDYDLKYPYLLGYMVGFMYNIKNKSNEIITYSDLENILNIINDKNINYGHLKKLLDIYPINIIIPRFSKIFSCNLNIKIFIN